MEKPPVALHENYRTHLVVVSIELLLLFLAPYFWDRWQAGQLPIPMVATVVFLAILLGSHLHYLSRWSDSVSSRLSFVWLMGALLSPMFMQFLDMSLAAVVRLLVIILLTFACGEYLVELGDTLAAITVAIVIVIVSAFSYSVRGIEAIGFCHYFSDFRESGCVRSIPLTGSTPVVLAPNPTADGDQLIRSYDTAIWTESINRWSALFDSRHFMLDTWISYLTVNAEGTRLHAYQTMPVVLPYATVTSHTLIDLRSREILDEVFLDLSDPNVVQNIGTDLIAYQSRLVSPSDVHLFATSVDSQWQAMSFYDGTVDIWQIPANEEANQDKLEELSPVPKIPPIPDKASYWRFSASPDYHCLTFFAENTLLAGYGNGVIDIFDIQLKRQFASIALQTSPMCPVFSIDGSLVAVANNIGSTELYVVDIGSGEPVTRLQFGEYSVGSMDFSSDNRYLIVSVNNVGHNLPRNGALIFDLEKTLGE